MKLEIIAPNMHISYDNIEYIRLPSSHGECGILPNHAPIVIALEHGILQCKQAGTTTSHSIYQGFATVTENTVRVLTETIENV